VVGCLLEFGVDVVIFIYYGIFWFCGMGWVCKRVFYEFGCEF